MGQPEENPAAIGDPGALHKGPGHLVRHAYGETLHPMSDHDVFQGPRARTST